MVRSHVKALSPSLLVVALLGACGDMRLVAPDPLPIAAPRGGAPLRSITEQEAFATADPYYVRDVLAPFGSDYNAFFDDPEAISDSAFEEQAPYSVASWEISPFEVDATTVNDYCDSVNDGVGGCHDCVQPTSGGGVPSSTDPSGESTLNFWLTCEEKWERCWQRCRRLFDRRARALCWGGCAASYALCVRRRRGG
jgi:hypothetical protein